MEHEDFTRKIPESRAAVAVSASRAAAVRDSLELSNITIKVEDLRVVNNLHADRGGEVPLNAVIVEMNVGSLLEFLGVAKGERAREHLGLNKVSHDNLVRDSSTVDQSGVTAVVASLLSREHTGEASEGGLGASVVSSVDISGSSSVVVNRALVSHFCTTRVRERREEE